MLLRRTVVTVALALAAVAVGPLDAHAAPVDEPPEGPGTMTIQVVVPAHASTDPGNDGGVPRVDGPGSAPARDPLARTGLDADLLWPLTAAAIGAIAVGAAFRSRAGRRPRT